MKLDIITFGSATVDIYAQTSDSDVTHLCMDDHCEDLLVYHPGDKVLLEDLSVQIGGGGTNTAACFQKLHIQAGFAGPIGTDSNGDQVLEYLRNNNIVFAGPRVDKQTNTSVVLDSHKLDDRTILTYKGASNYLRIQDLDLQALHATWWYSSSLVGQSFQSLLSLMRYAKQHDIAFAFNPSAYQTQLGLDALRECIELSTALILNKQEAQMLVGQGNRADLCRRLHQAGADIVCVTEGKYGASLLYADSIYHMGSEAKNIIETTGAGDCFAATLIAGFMQGFEAKQALIRAGIHSEHLIQHVGAKQGLLTKQQLDTLLQADKREIVIETR